MRQAKSGQSQYLVIGEWLSTIHVARVEPANDFPFAAVLTAAHHSSDVKPRPFLYAALYRVRITSSRELWLSLASRTMMSISNPARDPFE